MKLELEPNPSAFPFIDNDFTNAANSDNGSALVKPLLQRGIKAAQEGNRSEAKQVLLRVTEIEPRNENAWMWLASISEYPEELLGYLNNVLSVNPTNDRALEWTKSTKSLLANNFIQRGINASKESQKEFARRSFMQAIAHDEENEVAWLWLASASDSVGEKTLHLRKVLNINPENESALTMLKSIKKQTVDSLFKKAISEAVSDDRAAANETLTKVLEESPGMEDAWALKSYLSESFSEKIVCYEKILEINPDSPLANVNWTVLLEIMSRVESADLVKMDEPGARPTGHFQNAAPEQNENQADDVYEIDLSEETFDITQNPEEIFFIRQNKVAELSQPEAALFTEENNAATMPTQKLEYMPVGFSEVGEKEADTKAAFAFDETEENHFSETLVLPEPEVAPQQPVDFYAPKEAASFDLPVQYFDENVDAPQQQRENAAESFAEAGSPSAAFEYSANFDSSVNNSGSAVGADEEEEETNFSPAEKNEVFYYETDEDIFAPAQTVETEYNRSVPLVEEFDEEKSIPATVETAAEMFEPATQTKQESAEVTEKVSEVFFKTPAELVTCPYCKAKNEPQEFVCNQCHTMLTLSNLEMLLAHHGADKNTLQYALEEIEAAGEKYDLDAEELKTLGIGHINLKNLRLGCAYLQDSLKLNPNDVVLSSQINALSIRLAEIEQQENIHSSTPKNRKILVVDDSATVRKLISAKLEKSGHEVLCAIDGIEALEKINEIMPDLILLDINMPRMDGYQVCKLIRNNEATKDVPVVMISGKDGFFDKVRGRMAGTTGYITKPFGPETLMKTVETYIVQ